MSSQNDNHKYDDIINLPHHTSTTHPRMSASARAAQFSPFAALTGYDAAVKETARLTDRRVELDEYEKAKLDERLRLVQEHLSETPEVSITYFVPDVRKSGGSYCTQRGVIKKIDLYEHAILIGDSRIPIDEIISIEGKIFNELNDGLI